MKGILLNRVHELEKEFFFYDPCKSYPKHPTLSDTACFTLHFIYKFGLFYNKYMAKNLCC